MRTQKYRQGPYGKKTYPTDLYLPVELLRQLPDQMNSVISPFGIKAVLALAANGGSGQGLQEILTVLEAPSLETLNEQMRSIKDMKDPFTSACSIIAGKGLALDPDFEALARKVYGAAVSQVDGKDLTLKNIADFRGTWWHKMTLQGPNCKLFRNSDGTTASPPFLSLSATLEYYQDADGLQAVTLPYNDGEDGQPYAMTFVLTDRPPDRETLSRIFLEQYRRLVHVLIPKFHLNCTWRDLSEMLRQAGVNALFDSLTESFTGFTRQPLYASEAEQIAEITIDENGTTAIAVTLLHMKTTSCMGSTLPEIPVEFVADRPFYFFLHGMKDHEILFEGRVCQM